MTDTDTDTKEAIARLRQEMMAEFAALQAALRVAVAALAAAVDRPKARKRRRLIPNAVTIAAMREPSVGPFHSVEELMADLNADD
jgi:hypothetical protein